MDQPSKLIGMYAKAKRCPTSSLLKVYSDVPVDTKTKSLSRKAISQEGEEKLKYARKKYAK